MCTSKTVIDYQAKITKVSGSSVIIRGTIDSAYIEALEARVVKLTNERDEITKRRAEACDILEEWRALSQKYLDALFEIQRLVFDPDNWEEHTLTNVLFREDLETIINKAFEDA